MKDLRSENDNLSEWRKKRAILTEELLKDSIKELIKLKATISQKTVSEMMEKLASNEHKEFKAVITPSAISKNEIYKNIVLEGKNKVQLLENKKQSYKLDGDKQFEAFQLKSLIAKKEVRIKELESIIDRANINLEQTINYINSTNENNYKDILKELIEFILKEGVAYLDTQKNLINESTGDILITSKIIKEL